MEQTIEREDPRRVLADLRAARASRHPRPQGMQAAAVVEMAIAGWAVVAAVLWLLVQGHVVDASTLADIRHYGPAVIGLTAWLILVASMRSGLNGGPLSPERADVLHLMLAPVPRGLVLRQNARRWVFAGAFGGALVGATLAAVSEARLGGNVGSATAGLVFGWGFSGLLAGLLIGILSVAPGMTISGLHVRSPLIWAVGLVTLGLTVADLVLGTTFSPLTWIGEIAVWPLHPAISIVLPAVVGAAIVVLSVVAVVVGPGVATPALDRRAGLAQLLLFTAQLLDLRGFLRLRMVLANERARDRPWLRLPWPRSARWAIWQRHTRSLLRWPIWRVGRVVVLGILVTGLLAITVSGSSYLILGAGALMYFLCMDLYEPWWQEVEHGGLTERLPVTTSWLFWRHLLAALISGCLLGAIAVVVMAVARVPAGGVVVAAITVIPAVLGGLLGAAVRAGAPGSRLERIADNFSTVTPQGTMDFGAMARAARIILPLVPAIVGLAPAAVSGGVTQRLTAAVVAILIEVIWFLFLRVLPLFEVD